ncbi:SRRM1 protein, partial [Acromyrmex heyeri]
MKFGDSLTQKVDMSKVKLDVIKPWITTKITQILGMEDDVVVEFVYNQLEEKRPLVGPNPFVQMAFGCAPLYIRLAAFLSAVNPSVSCGSWYLNVTLELPTNLFPDPRKMQINLTGFLNGRNARSFMGELWDLLVSAQESVTGIPEAFLQQKKDQIKKRLVIISFHL